MRPPIDRGMAALCGVLVAAVVSTRWVRLNISPSVAYGLYRLVAVPTPIARGMLVVLPVPASVQHAWSRWIPLLKPVAGVEGDHICVQDGTLWIDGVFYGAVVPDSHGQALPHLTGCVVVQEGEVFLASPVVHSLDSRYFGAVSVTDITAVAFPLVTWR